MNPLTAALGRVLTPPLSEADDGMAKPCGTGGAGARLGSPPTTPGVFDEARPEPVVSPLESGSVGFLSEANNKKNVRSSISK